MYFFRAAEPYTIRTAQPTAGEVLGMIATYRSSQHGNFPLVLLPLMEHTLTE
jgi:hypothetical protein